MNNKNIYIIGTGCFARSLHQVLIMYYSECTLLDELPKKGGVINNFSTIVCTPSILPEPIKIIQIFKELFGKKIINWSAMIGILMSNQDIKSLKKNDIYGGKDKSLTVDSLAGLGIIHLPLKLPEFLIYCSNLTNLTNDYFKYNLVEKSLLFTIKEELNEYINDNRQLSGKKYIEVKKIISSLNLIFALDRGSHSVDWFRDTFKKFDQTLDIKTMKKIVEKLS